MSVSPAKILKDAEFLGVLEEFERHYIRLRVLRGPRVSILKIAEAALDETLGCKEEEELVANAIAMDEQLRKGGR